MQFAAPSILWALFLLAIPILVHLFDFRRYRKQFFSDTYFLKQVIEKNKKYSHLRQLIIMSLRMLAIAAIVLAFARPYIPSKDIDSKNAEQLMISIYIDNSMSMEAGNDKLNMFETARKKAKDIVDAYPQNILFRLISNDFDATDDRFVSKDEFIERLNTLKISSNFRHLSEIMQRINNLTSTFKYATHNVFIISDFQKSSSDFKNSNWKNSNIFFIPLASQSYPNIGIDSVWFNTPVILKSNMISINAKIRNYSNILIEKIPVRLYVDDKQRGLSDIQIASGGSETISFNFTINNNSNTHSGHIEIDDSPITFDDKMYFAFTMTNKIPVVRLYGNNADKNITAIFANDSLFNYSQNTESNIDFDKLAKADFIILDGLTSFQAALSSEIINKINKGANVLFIPSENYKNNIFSSFFKTFSFNGLSALDTANTKVSYIDYEHPLFKDVFETAPRDIKFPSINNSFIIPSNQGRCLMKMMNGNSFLSELRHGQGRLYIMAVAMKDNFSDFQTNALIVPTFMQMAFAGRATYSISYPIDYAEGIPFQQSSRSSDNPPHLLSFDSKIDIIPSFSSGSPSMLYLMNQCEETGPYKITNDNETLAAFALNHNRNESFPEIYTKNELSEFSKVNKNISLFDDNANITSYLSEIQYGKRLWKIFLIFALIFLGLEVTLLRIWKTV